MSTPATPSQPTSVAFLVTTLEAGGHGGDGIHHMERFAKGDEVIWVVRRPAEVGSGGDATLLTTENWEPIVPLPARRLPDTRRWGPTLAWAQAAESVWRLPPDERVPKLLSLTHNPVPQVASWAVLTLGIDDVARGRLLMRQLAADPTTGVAALSVADERLCAMSGQEWGSSPERLAMFRRIASSPLTSDYDARAAVRRLEDAINRKNYPADELAEVCATGALNIQSSEHARTSLLALLGSALRQASDDRQPIFCAALLRIAAAAPTPDERYGTARELAVKPLNRHSLAMVAKASETISDARTADVLRGIVRSSQPDQQAN